MAPVDSGMIVRPRAPDAGAALPSLYDFARPQSFSERHLRLAAQRHAALAEALAARLTARLGEPVEVQATAIVEVQAGDFVRSRARPDTLAAALTAHGAVVVDLPAPLALLVVERHLGGGGPLDEAARPLSPLERRVVAQHALPLVGAALAAAWRLPAPAIDPAPGADPAALGPRAAPVVVADLDVHVAGGTATLSLAYPAPTLRALLAHPQASAGAPAPPAAHLDGLPLDVRAELGRARLTVADVLHLAPGDVIPLDRPADAPVPVWIGDRLHATARAGARGTRLALHLMTAPAPLSSTP